MDNFNHDVELAQDMLDEIIDVLPALNAPYIGILIQNRYTNYSRAFVCELISAYSRVVVLENTAFVPSYLDFKRHVAFLRHPDLVGYYVEKLSAISPIVYPERKNSAKKPVFVKHPVDKNAD